MWIGAFALDDRALRILLALAHVLLDHLHAFHNHPLLSWARLR